MMVTARLSTILLVALLLGAQTAAAAEPVPVDAVATPRPDFRRSAALAPVELRVAMDPLDGEVLFRKEPFDTSTFALRVLDGGEALDARVAVSGSFSRRYVKKSLQIRLDDGRRWRDNSRVSLKAMSTDPSYLREWAVWDLAHALGMVAPNTEMVRLFINDRFVGPFMFFDWIDAGMMERRGLGGDGALYHPDDIVYCGGLEDPGAEALRRCWQQFAPRGGDFSELQTLARQLHDTPVEEFERYLDANFDVDSVLDWILLNTISSNTDTYNKNYFLYLSRKTGKWVVVPWDYDLSFGRNADPVLPYPESILNANFQYFYTPELGNPHPLKEKLLRNPALYRRFAARLAHVLGVRRDPSAPEAAFGWFEPERFRDRLREWAHVLEVDVEHDRYRSVAPSDFREHVEALDYYALARHHALRHKVVEPTVFGTARWLPYTAYPLLAPPAPEAARERQHQPLDLSATVTLVPGARVVPVDDQYSRPLGVFKLPSGAATPAGASSAPLRVRLEAETERPPALVPEGKSAAECIARTWFVDLKTPGEPVRTALIVDYLQESSIHHELGGQVGDARRLELWANAGEGWQRLPTRSNPVAKTLATDALALQPGRVVRLVACAP